MATILGAGQRYDRIIGVGGITTSIDGYVWSSSSEVTEPFPPRMKAQGIAVNGDSNVFVAISDNGYAATSTDLQSWSNVRLLDSDFTALGISWGENGSTARPVFAVAGSRIYNDDNILPQEYELNDQIAQVLINESGSIYTWDQAFTHPENGSWFHNVRYFSNVAVSGVPATVWVAVGHVNGVPDVWYSPNINWLVLDPTVPDPDTWQRLSIPAAYSDRPFYDVAFYQGRLYFSARGIITSCDDLGDPSWEESRVISLPNAKTDFLGIAVNPDGHMAAVSSGCIIFSRDRSGWSEHSREGYHFTSIAWFNDHWIAGAYSLLTQYTYFTSTDGETWIPRNNGIQIYGMTSY